jgi:hypothetical protein
MTNKEHKCKYKYYLYDLGFLLKEEVLKVKRERDNAKGTPDYGYASGQLLALYGVITLMQQQAEGFGISLEELRLEDIDPDRDLI